MDHTKTKLLRMLKLLWSHLSPRRKRQFGVLSLLMLLSAFVEVVSLGTLLPFIGIATAPDMIFKYGIVKKISSYFDIGSSSELLLPVTIIFIITALSAGAVRILLLWFSSRLAFASGADISAEVYKRTLYQPYSVHVSRNSSVVISGITVKVSMSINTLYQILTALSSAVLLVAIMTTLVIINPVVAISSVIILGTCYFLISLMTRAKLKANSEIAAYQQTRAIKALQEGLGGIRDVLLDSTQEFYCDIYQKADRPLRKAKGDNLYLSGCPRFVLEGLVMSLIAFLAYVLSRQPEGMTAYLPTLAVLALGAQRVLPVLQQGYTAWASILGDYGSLTDTISLLDQPLPDLSRPSSKLPFYREIELKNINFRYNPEGPLVLNDLSLKILKGSRIGLIGATGSGKSTLIDLLMGLISPTSGSLEVDGKTIQQSNIRDWQHNIAHVPQSIYLADSTLAENIAFGLPAKEIDFERVKLAAKQAQVEQFIEKLPEGYNTFVGERGVRLSGGQRQRIGIARALYKQASLLVFDEATSALDNDTERSVMEGIEGLSRDLTMIIIAHRLSTLEHCDLVIELKNGKIAAMGTYDQLVRGNADFHS